MFLFLISWIVISIIVSILATWFDLVPRFPERKYSFLQQAANTAILTLILTVLLSFNIYPSWFIVSVIIVVTLLASVRLTNVIIRMRRRSGP